MTTYEQSITVIIHTKNSANTLQRTLDSVSWATEVLVVDMHSTDETLQIAKKNKVRIETVPDYGYVEPARNAAINMAKSGWICIVDSDEVISEKLATKLQQLAQGDATADAYWIARKNIVFGGWLHSAGWWPDYQLRFFKKGTVGWPEKIHATPKIDGTIDYLTDSEDLAIEHFNYPDVASFLERLNRYTTHEVSDRQKKDVSQETLVNAWSNEFFSRVFVHKGIDGGVRGLGISWLQAMYELVVQLKMWEQQQNTEHPNTRSEEGIKAIEKFSRDLNYWIADYKIRQSSGLTQLVWRVRRTLKV